MYLSINDFRKRTEFSLCQQFASDDDVLQFCRKALDAEVGFACVNPVNVKQAADFLSGHGIEISGNVGCPFGSHPSEVKALETIRCVENGATQIDMVIQVGALRSKRDDIVFDDIKEVV
jgi:deoxyribose-phosphate aldolase